VETENIVIEKVSIATERGLEPIILGDKIKQGKVVSLCRVCSRYEVSVFSKGNIVNIPVDEYLRNRRSYINT